MRAWRWRPTGCSASLPSAWPRRSMPAAGRRTCTCSRGRRRCSAGRCARRTPSRSRSCSAPSAVGVLTRPARLGMGGWPAARRWAPHHTREDQVDPTKLLEADHRQVEALFEAIDKAEGDARTPLIQELETSLKAHMELEESVLYPAMAPATGGEEVEEANKEHEL